MKQFFCSKSPFLLLLVVAFFTLSLKEPESGNAIPAIPTDTTHIEFMTDRRVETCYIVFLLSDYPVMTPFETSYKSAALNYFEPYRNHKAVSIARDLIKKKFYMDYAVNWLFQHSEIPEFANNQTINFPFDTRPMNADSLELFRKELIQFYYESNCDSFFKSQESFLNQMVSGVKNSFSRKDIIQVIENYFGIKKAAKYHVILSPLLHSGGFAVERTDKNELYALIGPGGVKDSLPEFEKAFLEYDMVIHEFSHNYSNVIVDQFKEETKKYENILFPPVKEKVMQEGYSTWESFMMELIVRASTIRIVENAYGMEAAEELRDYEKSAGFEYVVDIEEELKIYELQRNKYPGFKDFYPNIIRRLGQIKK